MDFLKNNFVDDYKNIMLLSNSNKINFMRAQKRLDWIIKPVDFKDTPFLSLLNKSVENGSKHILFKVLL